MLINNPYIVPKRLLVFIHPVHSPSASSSPPIFPLELEPSLNMVQAPCQIVKKKKLHFGAGNSSPGVPGCTLAPVTISGERIAFRSRIQGLDANSRRQRNSTFFSYIVDPFSDNERAFCGEKKNRGGDNRARET